MTLGGFLVTFARPHILKGTIESILAQTRAPDVLLIVDNEASEVTETMVRDLGDERLVYLAMDSNLGSAGGTAFGFQWIAEQGYDWAYCGDDDNPPRTDDTLERLMAVLETVDKDVAGIGAGGARWDWKKGELHRLSDADLENGVQEVDLVGAGFQCILRREALLTAGVPERRFFFGYPDLNHCLRLRTAGWRLLVHGELMLEYRALAGRRNLEIKRSLTPTRPYHGVWRTYYTTRNYIYMMRETFDRPDLARRFALKSIAKCATAWLRGPRYALSFTAMQARGIFDGYRSRLGQVVMPQGKPAPASS